MPDSNSKIPKHHGEFYFDPPMSQWKEEALRNRERLVKQTLWGQTAHKVRSALKLPTDQPLVLSGHQPIFFHPGVWAKCLAASILAESISGTACHKITDTAITGEYTHYLPEVEDNGKSRQKKLEFFHSKDMQQQELITPYAYLPAPDFVALEKIFADAQVYCPNSIKPLLQQAQADLNKGLKKEATWNDFHQHVLHLLDNICGTKRLYLTGSKLWASEPFQHFLANWLTNLPEMTEAYNQSLDEYRKKYGITHELTPMPNLKFENWWFEIPFWGVTKYHHRDSAWAKKEGKHLMLKVKGGTFSLNFDDLHQEIGTLSLSLWPKAIPQTLFCRMYLCDFFIHGVGGSTYEEVGDILFTKVFKMPPPSYGVVSATYLVDPKEYTSLEKILSYEEKAEWWARAMEKNPEYLFTKAEAWQKELPPLLHPKFKSCLENAYLRTLAQSKVKWITVLQDPKYKTEASYKIKEINSALYNGCGEALKALEHALLDIDQLKKTKDVLGYREYPYFCFPPQMFVDMEDKIRQAAHLEKTETPAEDAKVVAKS